MDSLENKINGIPKVVNSQHQESRWLSIKLMSRLTMLHGSRYLGYFVADAAPARPAFRGIADLRLGSKAA